MLTTRIVRCLPALLSAAALAQSTSTNPLDPPPNGMRITDPSWHALVDATVHIAPGQVLEHATVVIRDGVIVSVTAGADAAPPAPEGARVWDLAGEHIYPGLIDAYVEAAAPALADNSPGRHWNPRVTPQRDVLAGPGIDAATRTALRKIGFAAAGIAPDSGIFRGGTAVVSLADPPADASAGRAPVYASGVFDAVSFETAGFGDDERYPNSHMGAVALMRQTLIDASWQADARAAGQDIPANALDAIEPNRPMLFTVDSDITALSADTVAREFGREAIIVGAGAEFRRLGAIAAAGRPMIIPLRFPKDPDVSSLGAIESMELEDLMVWEQAPTNPRRLHDAGLTVALTSSKLRERGDFMGNLRKAIKNGLTEDDALAMLTTTPAELLGVSDRLGTIAQGRIANLIVLDKPIFDEKAKLFDVWIDGRRHEIDARPPIDAAGVWAIAPLNIERDAPATLTLNPDKKEASFTIEGEGTFKGRKFAVNGNRVSFILDDETQEGEPAKNLLVSAVISGDSISGWLRVDENQIVTFSGTRTGPLDPAADKPAADKPDADKPDEGKPDPDKPDADKPAQGENKDDTDKEEAPADLPPETYGMPFGPYAIEQPPEQRNAVFFNATIWTSGPAGVIDRGWVMIRNGKVAGVGRGEFAYSGPERFELIDCEGRHITPGIIDAHSHTGLFQLGVNEGTQSCTAEVRIHDALDPSHISWYRQLAGGVTTVNSLHGSANAIGGQNAIHKNRWGAQHPDDMLLEGATPGIKFALGENVKQSNWGERFNTRYPQTRMGVETFIRDRFLAAREYMADPGARRDLELETLAQILRGERLIHCHSYRQDEILMLARISEEFGFTIGSYQHGLECYKVAEAVRERSRGASIFSDWWQYKVEVQDAIPYAGPIMYDAGVRVSYNSDDDELARRLNNEAAKAVKYGDVPPEEALKFVTINPAIQLGIDRFVGSLEAGKDADLAIWSGDPLSALSICEATWIDGREYFSLARDAELRERNAAERERIIAGLLKGAPKKKKDQTTPDGASEGAPEGASEGGADEGAEPPSDPRVAAMVRQALFDWLDNTHPAPAHGRGDCGCSEDSILHTLLHR